MLPSDHPVALTSTPVVLLVGDTDSPEFDEATRVVAAGSRVQRVRDPSRLFAHFAGEHAAPHLVVWAQSRPAQLPPSALTLVRKAVPQAQHVYLAGSWCEGEIRNGTPWSDGTRLYWYEFPTWWQREVTAPRGCDAAPRHDGLVVVNALDWESASTLTDVLQREGYATVWDPRGRVTPVVAGAMAGIWIGGQLSDAETRQLTSFCQSQRPAARPTVVLLDFPRIDRVRAALDAGATAVLGKPWQIEDLLAHLSEAICTPRISVDPPLSDAA